ncbi:MAG: pyruvate kinase [Chloroflexi bacterium]|nr:pyruvate kinase [Chloroflexota bacterium]
MTRVRADLRRTKIVSTIGPASSDPEVLEALIIAGMNVARMNFSHGTHEFHAQNIANVRDISAQLGIPVAVLADLQGPKLRIGMLPEAGLDVSTGDMVRLTIDDIEGHYVEDQGEIKALIPLQYKDLPKDVGPGDRILIGDGLLELEATASDDENIDCRVLNNGTFLSRKGINVPTAELSIPAITEKDWADVEFILTQDIDWIALSFVRKAEEVYRLKQYLTEHYGGGYPIRIISKIEKPQAVERLSEIIEASDGIMVARGDLGIEIPAEQVPNVQKDMIRRCNAAGKPVITATHLLESMTKNPRPTRAEARDVANAILDGSDAIMTSAETASGDYPVKAVETMAAIAREIEKGMMSDMWRPPEHVKLVLGDVTDAVSYASCETAHRLNASVIIAPTASGRTARSIAKYRPHTPILAVTPNAIVQHQLVLSWGVYPLLSKRLEQTESLREDSVKRAVQSGFARSNDRVVVTAGVANNVPGMTNLLTVEVVDEGHNEAPETI